MKLYNFFVLMVFSLTLIPSLSQAKYSHSSSYSGSSHSYSSHSYSYGGGSNHSFFSYSKPSAPSSSFAYSKPSMPSSSFAYSKPVSSGSYGSYSSHSFTASSSNYKSMNSYSSKYVSSSPISRSYYSTPTYSHVYSQYHSADGYYAARQHDIAPFYARYPEPSYMYHYHSSYGIWDAYFLYLLLQHANEPSYDQWAYAHQNDPAYQQFISQAQTDPNLQAQVNTLQAQVNALQAQKATPESPDVLPGGISTAVAVSPTAVAQDAANDNTPSHHWILDGVIVLAFFGAAAYCTKKVLTPKTAVNW